MHGEGDPLLHALRRGAKCEARNVGGLTPLHLAAFFGHAAAAKVLLSRWDIGRMTTFRAAACAAKRADMLVKGLTTLSGSCLQQPAADTWHASHDRADVLARDERSRTPLCWAAYNGNDEVLHHQHSPAPFDQLQLCRTL